MSEILRVLVVTAICLHWVLACSASTVDDQAPKNAVEVDCEAAAVRDGDSLAVDCAGVQHELRLYCIDAPELAQRPWGNAARAALLERVDGAALRYETVEEDDYGRLVARVSVAGIDLAEQLVREGAAVVYRRYCPAQAAYYTAERSARAARLGVWRVEGIHQTPWAYRAAQRR